MFRVEPIYNISDKKVLYYELLVNNHFPNNILFAVANPELEFYILQEAIKFMKNKNIQTKIAINISKITLMRFIDEIVSIIKTYPNIFLEIIENEHNGYSIYSYEKLNLISNHLILDDFGHKFNNFDILNKLSIYAIKIDKDIFAKNIQVFKEIHKQMENRNILCIYEKIENKELYDIVINEIGGNFMQGFFLKVLEYDTFNNFKEEVAKCKIKYI